MQPQSVINKFICLSVFVLSAFTARGQQDPLYALYLNNPFVLNPAYSGINNKLDMAAGFRNQWAGFDGHPTTTYAGAHLSLNNNKMGAGFLAIQDKIGENRNLSINGSFAYHLELPGDKIFSFGMQAGIVNYKSDPSEISLQDPDDPAFAPVSETKLNIGTGVLLKSERFMIGLSVPKLLNNSLTLPGVKLDAYQRHYYLLGSYNFYLSHRIIFRPAVLLKGTASSPISADVNFNIDIDKLYTVGVFSRNLQTAGVLAQIRFMKNYRLAYALEVPGKNSVGQRFVTNEVLFGISTAVFQFHHID